MLDMREKGVRVDLNKTDVIRKELRIKVRDYKAEIKRRTGIDIEPWANASVAKVFKELGVDFPKTEAGSPSFTKHFLNAHPNEIAQMIVKLREFDKADSTFIDSIMRHEHKGRIHTEFHQLRKDGGGTVTGRFSSSNPNLQQFPARDPDIKKAIRGLFLPEEGDKWGSFDYSSQEPRLLVHFASSLPDSMKHSVVDTIVDEYNNGDVDLHQMAADLAGISRKEAKVVNLGIMYGMGVGKLSNQLDISKDEAKDILELYNDKVPFVKQIATIASQRATTEGQIRTILGRRCRFHLWEPRTFGYNKAMPLAEAEKEYGGLGMLRRAFTYKALNKLIQGSAADQTKKAMVDCYAENFTPMLTVHDELCFSVQNEEQAKRITEIMETGLPLNVPTRVDCEMGDNWGEAG